MARKTKDVTIEHGRDAGKTFRITEMPVTKADKWANTALLAMMRGGVDVGNVNFGLIANTVKDEYDEVDGKKVLRPKVDPMGGMLELARISIAGLGNVTDEVGQELLDQLIDDCVKVVASSGTLRDLLNVDDEIQDLKTLWTLRKESFLIHISFLAEGSSPN